MLIETPEELERSYKQIENFARRAHTAKVAVAALDAAFRGLADYPGHLEEPMPELVSLANYVANEAFEWAWQDNTEFDPTTQQE